MGSRSHSFSGVLMVSFMAFREKAAKELARNRQMSETPAARFMFSKSVHKTIKKDFADNSFMPHWVHFSIRSVYLLKTFQLIFFSVDFIIETSKNRIGWEYKKKKNFSILVLVVKGKQKPIFIWLKLERQTKSLIFHFYVNNQEWLALNDSVK